MVHIYAGKTFRYINLKFVNEIISVCVCVCVCVCFVKNEYLSLRKEAKYFEDSKTSYAFIEHIAVSFLMLQVYT